MGTIRADYVVLCVGIGVSVLRRRRKVADARAPIIVL